jgi:hypothetical protein
MTPSLYDGWFGFDNLAQYEVILASLVIWDLDPASWATGSYSDFSFGFAITEQSHFLVSSLVFSLVFRFGLAIAPPSSPDKSLL